MSTGPRPGKAQKLWGKGKTKGQMEDVETALIDVPLNRGEGSVAGVHQSPVAKAKLEFIQKS